MQSPRMPGWPWRQPHIALLPIGNWRLKSWEEQDPLKEARRIYDYITTHVMYSFVELFYLTDIPQYAASSHEGRLRRTGAFIYHPVCRVARHSRQMAGRTLYITL